MARRRKPAEEHALKGNPGKRAPAIVSTEKMPVLEFEPPSKMSKAARDVWTVIVPELSALKVLRRSDALTLSVLCEAFAEYALARLTLAKEGYTYEAMTVSGDRMVRLHPMYKILDRSRAVILQYSAEFGMTPISRFRIVQGLLGSTPPPPDDPRAHLSDSDGDDLLDLGPAVQDAGPVGYLA